MSQWTSPSEEAQHIAWAREVWKDIEPLTVVVYSNHLGVDDGATRVRAAYGATYDRLAALKQTWDSENLFRLNNSIPPSGR